MRPTWLFEADVFGRTAEPLKAEIRRQGMVWHATRQDLLSRGSNDSFGGRRFAEMECVIACGCIPFVRHILDKRRWSPGGWCNLENLACSAYYPHFNPWLLNRRHVITTGIEATNHQDAIFGAYARDDKVFVRPDGCQKTITGHVVKRSEFASAIAPTRYNAETKIVVAEPRPVGCEWRLIVADGVVITGGQYLDHGEIVTEPGCPANVHWFAADVLKQVSWRPDEIFMMDVCESNGELYVLELNGFSTSAIYPCDYRAVVSVASDMAVRCWHSRSDSA